MSADTTAALARAQDALANAGAATAALARSVLDAQNAAERREREAARHIADADARTAEAVRLTEEALKKTEPSQAERAAYLRGYHAGYSTGKRGKADDAEGALNDPRNQLRAVAA